MRICAGVFFVFPTTRSENDGHVCFSLRNSDFGEHRLLGENVLGQVEFQFDAGEHGARKHAGNQNARKQAGEHHEEQIVSGVDGGEDQNEDDAKVHHPVRVSR